MPTKNLRQGRVRVASGDKPRRLEKTCAFTEGDFTYTVTTNVIQIKDRGALSHLRKGDEEAIAFSFSAKFVDKTLYRTLKEFIWEGQAETIDGLTASSNNAAAVDYAYEQGSLLAASGDAISTKLANGATPSSANEYSENVGANDQERLVTEVRPGGLQVYPDTGDTDFAVTYDAVGKSTLDPGDVPAPRCPADVKTFLIVLEKELPELAGVVSEVYELNHAYLESVEQAEGDEYDTVSFTGVSYLKRPSINELLAGGASVIRLELEDSVIVDDALLDADVEVL